jgi:hypothetical protein
MALGFYKGYEWFHVFQGEKSSQDNNSLKFPHADDSNRKS